MKKLIFALLALCACSQQTPPPAPAAHDDHIGMAGMGDAAAPVQGASATIGQLSITNAWAAATPNGVDTAAAYLTIANAGSSEDRLVSASSPRAARVETHEMTMDGAMMQMRKIDGIAVPAGGAASLAPGGMHLMFFDITGPFADGESVPVTLTFAHAGQVTLAFPVHPR